MSLKKLLGKRSKRDRAQEGSGLSSRSSQKKIAATLKQGGHKGGTSFYSNKLSYDDLINAESELGRTIFGPIPAGHNREFFEARKNVWIWHESFVNPQGVMEDMTVRYEVRPNGVFKRPGSGKYRKIEGVELDNFRKAAHIYLELVKAKLYS